MAPASASAIAEAIAKGATLVSKRAMDSVANLL